MVREASRPVREGKRRKSFACSYIDRDERCGKSVAVADRPNGQAKWHQELHARRARPDSLSLCQGRVERFVIVVVGCCLAGRGQFFLVYARLCCDTLHDDDDELVEAFDRHR
jgi:hypothetical protein